MAWYISKDVINFGDDDGQWNARAKIVDLDICKEVCKHKFRMKDDDGEIYYYGFSDDSSSFEPLDDFGMPNAGCTSIEYYEDGVWKYL